MNRLHHPPSAQAMNCRLSLRERVLWSFFRGAKGDRAESQVMRTVWLSLFFVVPGILSIPQVRAGVDAPTASADRWIAPDAIVCLEVAHPDRLIELATDARFQNYLMLVPQFQKLIKGKQFGELSNVVKVISAQLDTTWDKGLVNLAGGGILGAFEADPGKEPRLYVIITAKDTDLLERTNQTLLKLARQDAKNKGTPDPVKTSEHRGTAIHAPASPLPGAYAIVAGKLVISNSTKNLQILIDRAIDGSSPEHGFAAAAKSTRPSLADQADWKALKARQGPDAFAWGLARLDRLRTLDPNRFNPKEKPDTGVTLLFGSWYEVFRKASSLLASLSWSDAELTATLELPVSKDGLAAPFKGYVPAAGKGAVPPIQPPSMIASLSLWRDWSTIWESRSDLFPPETVQGFAQLDTFAGQFFGVREFGPDVLGAFEPHWRLVVARQDYEAIKPPPDLKLPAFALVTELSSPDSDFAQRLKVAFQTFVGLSNVDAVQKKGPPFELGSEVVEGITLATATYMVNKATGAAGEAPNQRYNFSPSAAQVGKYFFLSSSADLGRSLIKELKLKGSATSSAAEGNETVLLEADGHELAKLLEQNRTRIAARFMLGRGETKQNADRQAESLLNLVRYLGHGRALVRDDPAATQLEVKLQFSK
jgi:hypothetical protein